MEFKQHDAQNQRIEHITSNHIVVGIDIANETQVMYHPTKEHNNESHQLHNSSLK
jgi:hypothetical protein